MPNLKPCPHGCTGTPEPLIFTYTDSPRYRGCVTCSECDAAGGVVNGNDEAAVRAEACVLWNRRADDFGKEIAAYAYWTATEDAARLVEDEYPEVGSFVAEAIRALDSKETRCTAES